MDFFRKNKTLLIILIIICGLIIMWGRSFIGKKVSGGALDRVLGRKAPEEESAEEIIPVKLTNAAKMDYEETITSFGTIKGFMEIPIKFREVGKLSKFYFKEGDEIEAGEVVVAQDQRAETLKLEYADIDYQKNSSIYELGGISKDKLRQSELELESAKLEIEKRNFYAPSHGFMGSRKVDEGEVVDPNTVVATFLDINSVFCEVGIIERDMGKVKVGQRVGVSLERFPADSFEGTVDSASPMVEGRSRTQNVRILIPNDKNLIKPGMFAKAEITIFEKKDAIVIPSEALHKTEDGYAVFGVVREETAKEKKVSAAGFEEAIARLIPVKLERATENVALIKEGLTEGQEIVLESPRAKEAIRDGGRVEIIGVE